MRAEIILTHGEKERLLAKTSSRSPARSVLHGAERKTNQPQLVALSCDEQAATDLLRLARHDGRTWRVMHNQMKRLGLVKSLLNER